jgi:uncharacterized membrane protein YfcA
VSYPPQPGYPQYGAPPPGYGYPPPRPSPALAYLTAALFLACGALSLVLAIISWDGTTDTPEALVATIGAAFSDDVTGNVDFAIATTMTVACTTITFALVQLARLDFVRWILAVIGGIVTAYYVYAVIYLLSHDGAEVIALVIVAFLLWLAATVVAVLPATGRAMRRRQQPGYQPAPPYPGYYGPR